MVVPFLSWSPLTQGVWTETEKERGNMGFKNKLIRLVLATASMFAAFSLPVYAEGEEEITVNTSVIEGKTADLTIKYFDDEDETLPVTDAKFTIYQVATIGRDFENNGAYIPLSDELDWSDYDDETVDEYEANVVTAYSKGTDLGYTDSATIGKDGKATFKAIPAGEYLVVESETIRYHIKSQSFLVAAPEMNEEGNAWNFDVTCTPKAVIAGDLKIEKTVHGKLASKNQDFTFKLTLPEGIYKADFADGTKGTVENGQIVTIKGGKSMMIYDLPSGSSYEVVEEHANEGYVTTYTNCRDSEIKGKDVQVATIDNDSTSQDMGVFNIPVYWMMGGVGAFFMLLFVLITKKNDKKQSKQN